MRPVASESEIRWVLHEAAKYLDPEFQVRREDVLSAWSGIRPLAMDPHAPPEANTSGVSRDHLISHNPKTGTVFISGGKWTTYREMAEDAIDKVIEVAGLQSAVKNKSTTLQRHLIGYRGYTNNLTIQLIQEFGVASSIAERLSKAYGGRARDVLLIARDELGSKGRGDKIAPGLPYIKAEIIYATRFEWACHATDILARRTRLAFLNKSAAVLSIPTIVELMGKELKWNTARKKAETAYALDYMNQFGGSVATVQRPSEVARVATPADIEAAFKQADRSKTGYLEDIDVMLASELLHHKLTLDEVSACMDSSSTKDNGTINLAEFIAWWNSESKNPVLVEMKEHLAAADELKGTGVFFG